MAKLRFSPGAPLSAWITYELANNALLDPPVLKLRLRPLDAFDLMDVAILTGDFKIGRTAAAAAVKAVAEWDLESPEGKPIPLEEDTKEATLTPLLGEQLKGKAPGQLLGIQIVKDARTRENFLKN